MKKILICLIAAAFTSSCTRYIPFTEDLRQSLQENGVDIKKIQFYSDKNFLLKRNAKTNTNGLEQGSISRNSTYIRETISFKSIAGSKLAGICTSTEQGTIAIQFEEGDAEKKKIMFYRQHYGEYKFEGQIKIVYDDHAYDIVEGKDARLLVSANETKDYIKSKRKVRGLRVD
ncbi:hypothetical protein [Emticicia sp. 17c]|uniref:hypothetical protein n=1 Tax=Emticicia sp. 17c TaxID=3127704 RepID=UPI00301D42D0